MPTYDYRCQSCGVDYQEVCSMREYNPLLPCPSCGEPGERQIILKNIDFIGTKVESAEFNPAFGKVIKNKRQRKYEAEKRGWVEVGNEKAETVHKEMDKTLKDNLSWDKVKI